MYEYQDINEDMWIIVNLCRNAARMLGYHGAFGDQIEFSLSYGQQFTYEPTIHYDWLSRPRRDRPPLLLQVAMVLQASSNLRGWDLSRIIGG